MNAGFQISEEDRGGHHRIALEGELDLAATHELQGALDRVRGSGASRLELDLRGVTFVDSMGVRSLLRAKQMCIEDGIDFVAIPNAGLRTILEVTGLLDALTWREALD